MTENLTNDEFNSILFAWKALGKLRADNPYNNVVANLHDDLLSLYKELVENRNKP